MDMISKVEAARIVRNQRRLEMMEFDSFFFRALERGATVKHVSDKKVEAAQRLLQTNPLESDFVRRQIGLIHFMLEELRAVAGRLAWPGASSSSSSSTPSAGDEVDGLTKKQPKDAQHALDATAASMTVTKIEFLEQQLDELRRLMELQTMMNEPEPEPEAAPAPEAETEAESAACDATVTDGDRDAGAAAQADAIDELAAMMSMMQEQPSSSASSPLNTLEEKEDEEDTESPRDALPTSSASAATTPADLPAARPTLGTRSSFTLVAPVPAASIAPASSSMSSSSAGPAATARPSMVDMVAQAMATVHLRRVDREALRRQREREPVKASSASASSSSKPAGLENVLRTALESRFHFLHRSTGANASSPFRGTASHAAGGAAHSPSASSDGFEDDDEDDKDTTDSASLFGGASFAPRGLGAPASSSAAATATASHKGGRFSIAPTSTRSRRSGSFGGPGSPRTSFSGSNGTTTTSTAHALAQNAGRRRKLSYRRLRHSMIPTPPLQATADSVATTASPTAATPAAVSSAAPEVSAPAMKPAPLPFLAGIRALGSAKEQETSGAAESSGPAVRKPMPPAPPTLRSSPAPTSITSSSSSTSASAATSSTAPVAKPMSLLSAISSFSKGSLKHVATEENEAADDAENAAPRHPAVTLHHVAGGAGAGGVVPPAPAKSMAAALSGFDRSKLKHHEAGPLASPGKSADAPKPSTPTGLTLADLSRSRLRATGKKLVEE